MCARENEKSSKYTNSKDDHEQLYQIYLLIPVDDLEGLCLNKSMISKQFNSV